MCLARTAVNPSMGACRQLERQGWRECKFCMEQKSALLPTSPLATPHTFIKVSQLYKYKGGSFVQMHENR